MVIGWGSSPHTRGARPEDRRSPCRRRIIPAYAGSTPDRRCARGCPGDHPRIRGEHGRRHPPAQDACGSSPHTRGAHRGGPVGAGRARIIPAYAGSTGSSDPGGLRRGDHPRIRGEHGAEEALDRDASGSSPHTRGARTDEWVDAGPARIIPAYAGSTRTSRGPCAASRDHPRIRGEHGSTARMSGFRVGSSPHTRGARHPPPVPALLRRIIPAYAGSTSRSLRRRPARWDHPRIRGEHKT